MNDSEYGKKELESMEFDYFLNAYREVTGKHLEVVEKTEKPDFICVGSKDALIGVEVTKVVRSPDSVFADRVLSKQEYMGANEACERIQNQILSKNEKRKHYQSQGELKFILAVQLMDCPLEELLYFLEKYPKEELKEIGFQEIWLADYTGVEAYGDIELFGLFPKKYWGYHQRKNPHRKPYD